MFPQRTKKTVTAQEFRFNQAETTVDRLSASRRPGRRGGGNNRERYFSLACFAGNSPLMEAIGLDKRSENAQARGSPRSCYSSDRTGGMTMPPADRVAAADRVDGTADWADGTASGLGFGNGMDLASASRGGALADRARRWWGERRPQARATSPTAPATTSNGPGTALPDTAPRAARCACSAAIAAEEPSDTAAAKAKAKRNRAIEVPLSCPVRVAPARSSDHREAVNALRP